MSQPSAILTGGRGPAVGRLGRPPGSRCPATSTTQRTDTTDSLYGEDPKVPAGYRDADLLAAELGREAYRTAALRRRGVCTHDWTQGMAAGGRWLGEGPAPEPGHVVCLHCGEQLPDPDEIADAA